MAMKVITLDHELSDTVEVTDEQYRALKSFSHAVRYDHLRQENTLAYFCKAASRYEWARCLEEFNSFDPEVRELFKRIMKVEFSLGQCNVCHSWMLGSDMKWSIAMSEHFEGHVECVKEAVIKKLSD